MRLTFYLVSVLVPSCDLSLNTCSHTYLIAAWSLYAYFANSKSWLSSLNCSCFETNWPPTAPDWAAHC